METQKSIVIMNLNVSDAIINHAFMDEFHECGGYLLGQVVEKDSLKYFYVTQIYYEKNIIGKENEFNFSILYEARAMNYAKTLRNRNNPVISLRKKMLFKFFYGKFN